jgi:hypothetical protein
MEKYTLKTKLGDKVFTLEAFNIENAEEKFSARKNLSITALLEIFIVEADIKTKQTKEI